MRLTRSQLRSLILREVRLLAEQAEDESENGGGDVDEYEMTDREYARRQAHIESMEARSSASRSRYNEDEVFLWLVQAGELDSEFDKPEDIIAIESTPEGAVELAIYVWAVRQMRDMGQADKHDSPEEFRVIPVKRKGQPVVYAALLKHKS